MKYNPYSSSKISKFYQCPKSFEYLYIQKIKIPKKDSEALLKGNIVHTLLQFHELSLSEKINKLKQDKEIHKSIFYTKEMIKDCVNIYNNFINSETGKRLLGYKKIAVEIGCGLDKKLLTTDYKNGELFRGYIDRVSVDIDTNIVYISDWKTGKDRSDGMFSQDPDQLIYYSTWYFETFPVDKIIINFVFVEHYNKALEYILTRENLPKYKKLLLTKISGIEKCEEFAKNETVLCQWCDYLEICNPNIIVK